MDSNHNRANWLTDTLSNRPFIVGMLFIGTYFVPFLILIGVALAYIFRAKSSEDWEASHYQYLIRTFWIVVLVFLTLASAILAVWIALDQSGRTSDYDLTFYFAIAGLVTMVPTLMLAGVRTILSLINSASGMPMPKPKSWLI